MLTLAEGKKIFDAAAQDMLSEFTQFGRQTGEEVVHPDQLVAATSQFFDIFAKLDAEHGQRGTLPYDNPSELGEHALNCLVDLTTWAERLGDANAKGNFDKASLSVADWVIRHHGEIRTLEPLVNAYAAEANRMRSTEQLSKLFWAMHPLLEHVSTLLRQDLDKYDPMRPWRMLNFNFAIVATRTQNPDLMSQAFDILGSNLPDDAPAFFEEGIKQAQKDVYSAQVKAVMQDYFNRWTVRH